MDVLLWMFTIAVIIGFPIIILGVIVSIFRGFK